MNDPTIAERVAAGAAWLDREVPDWVDRINLDSLSLTSACACILGQTFGYYVRAPLIEDGYDSESFNAYDAAAWPLGFQSKEVWATFADPDASDRLIDAYKRDAEYAALQDEWTRLILDRRREAVDA